MRKRCSECGSWRVTSTQRVAGIHTTSRLIPVLVATIGFVTHTHRDPGEIKRREVELDPLCEPVWPSGKAL